MGESPGDTEHFDFWSQLRFVVFDVPPLSLSFNHASTGDSISFELRYLKLLQISNSEHPIIISNNLEH